MKRIILSFVVLLAGMSGVAQTQEPSGFPAGSSQPSTLTPIPFIGCLSIDSVLTHMPQYAQAEQRLATLRQAYDAEMQRVEEEFNQKYESFLEGRRDFPRTILLKRQTELQQLLQRNVEFKEQCRQELDKARTDALQPLRQRISEAIAAVARRHHLLIVVNTDAEATPFIEPEGVLEIGHEVLKELETAH